MIQSNGDDHFINHEFDGRIWSAPILQTPEEVIRKTRELKLEGRVVKDIIAIGMGYNWSDNNIDDFIYNAMDRMPALLKEQIPNPEAFLPEGVEVNCGAEIDEPLIIVFEDGDSLGISFDDEGWVRMALNTIPLDIKPGINQKTFHAGRLFFDMIGKQIKAIEVTGTTDYPMFTERYATDEEGKPYYISRVSLIYCGKDKYFPRHKLSFEAWYDYGWVEILDKNDQILRIPTDEIPWIVQGFISEDVLNG